MHKSVLNDRTASNDESREGNVGFPHPPDRVWGKLYPSPRGRGENSLTPGLIQAISEKAKSLGVSQGDLIRQAVERSQQNKDNATTWWFGGGMDLTPYYGFEEDAVHFHQTCQKVLAPFGIEYYPKFKKWCDEYFYLKHRKEPRGIGGIFFDDFNETDFHFSFALAQSLGDHFLQAYQPILERRLTTPYTERERDFQAYRRGRYVEFNLIYDRGTLFGLQSGGRTESILMSLPPLVRWRYDWQPEKNSPEAKLYSDFLIRRDWI